jgi:hypothetical protein
MTPEHFKEINERISENYVMYAGWYQDENG